MEKVRARMAAQSVRIVDGQFKRCAKIAFVGGFRPKIEAKPFENVFQRRFYCAPRVSRLQPSFDP